MSESTYPNSRYAARLGDIPPCPSLQKVENVDVCVIGAGLAGLTTAVELLKLGKSVVVLEAGRVAIAASGRNGGFVAAGFAQSIDTVERRGGLQHAHGVALARHRVEHLDQLVGQAAVLGHVRLEARQLLARRQVAGQEQPADLLEAGALGQGLDPA